MLINIHTLRKFSLEYGHSEALVIAELSIGPVTKEELAARMGRTPRTIQSYLKPLVEAGIISKNPVSHVWSLSVNLINELSEKNSSITNRQTDISNNLLDLSTQKQKDSLKAQDIVLTTNDEESCQNMKKFSENFDHTKTISSEHYKAGVLACTIMFGQPINTFVGELASLLSEFETMDMQLVAASAHVVKRSVRKNPVMMFIATYRNKVRAHQLLTLVKSQPAAEDQEQDQAGRKNEKTYSNSFVKKEEVSKSFVGKSRGDKYDVFYQLYEKRVAE